MTATMTASSCCFEVHQGRGWLSSENSLVRAVNGNDANGYYRALGLKPDASREDIKAAFLKFVKTHHPDRGGDRELFEYLVQIVSVLLDPEKKAVYDSVSDGAIYLGDLEREQLARNGMFNGEDVKTQSDVWDEPILHWGCLTNAGSEPSHDTDTWINFVREVSTAVGYRGKVRVGVVDGGPSWPSNPLLPWGILSADEDTFVIFKRGVPPNRLHALCAMILLMQNKQRGLIPAQERREISWL